VGIPFGSANYLCSTICSFALCQAEHGRDSRGFVETVSGGGSGLGQQHAIGFCMNFAGAYAVLRLLNFENKRFDDLNCGFLCNAVKALRQGLTRA